MVAAVLRYEIKDPVTFYAAGNEADGDRTQDGDLIYTTNTNTSISQLAVPTPTPTPTSISTPPPPTPTPASTATVTPLPTPTPTATPTPTPGNIVGIVTDAVSQAGINGTTVSTDTGGYTTTTSKQQGKDGVYALSNVTAGSYVLTASATGYTSSSQSVTVLAGQITKANFALTPLSTPTPEPTLTVTPTPVATLTSTPLECETESMVVFPEELELKKGEKAEVVVTLVTTEGCPPEEGAIIKAKIKSGKGSVSISPKSKATEVHHTYGEASFVITAKNKKGKAKIKFKYKDLKVILRVKVVK